MAAQAKVADGLQVGGAVEALHLVVAVAEAVSLEVVAALVVAEVADHGKKIYSICYLYLGN